MSSKPCYSSSLSLRLLTHDSNLVGVPASSRIKSYYDISRWSKKERRECSYDNNSDEVEDLFDLVDEMRNAGVSDENIMKLLAHNLGDK